MRYSLLALMFVFVLAGIIAAFPALDMLDGVDDIGETVEAATCVITSVTQTSNNTVGTYCNSDLNILNDNVLGNGNGEKKIISSRMPDMTFFICSYSVRKSPLCLRSESAG